MSSIKADKITLGEYLKPDNEFYSNDKLIEIAEDFIEFQQLDEANLHRFNKLCRFGEPTAQLAVLQWMLEKRQPVTLKFRSAGAMCTVRVYSDSLSDGRESFAVTDFRRWSDLFVVIESLESIESGAGKVLLDTVTSVGVPTLLNAGFLYYGDYEMEREEMSDTLERLVNYYESAGFTNVNDIVGNYEESVVMLKASPELFKKIIKSKELNVFG